MTNWAEREWWPMAIALAWIVNPRLGGSRQIGCLRACRHIAGYVAFARAAGNSYLPMDLQREGPPSLDFAGAWYQLQALAADDKIAMRGKLEIRPSIYGAVVTGDELLPAAEIEHLILRGEVNDDDDEWLGPDGFKPGSYPPSTGRFWRRVTVSRDGLKTHFPPVDLVVAVPAGVAPANNTSGAEARCRVWLDGKMRVSPNERKGTRRDLETLALKTFPGLSQRGFGRAWDRAISATGATGWSKGGRPRKTLALETPAPNKS